MTQPSYSTITRDGLWYNNPATVQLLGLCPLLAVTGTAVNGLGLGLATLLVLVLSNVTVSLIRDWVRPEIRIPIFIVVIASFVTAVELIMDAWFHDLHKILGIFIPLIVTNCAILARAESFASRNSVPRAFADGLAMGLGFAAVLVLLGAFRELLGHGTLFQQADLMFGPAFADLQLTLFERQGMLAAILPPGAFIGLGLLIAAMNVINQRRERRRRAEAAVQPAEQAGA